MFDGPGRGRKQCPKCQNYIGVRCGTCPSCHHLFLNTTVRETPPEIDKTPYTPSLPHRPHILRIAIPSGECPVKLRDYSPEALLEWGIEVQAKMLERSIGLSVEGLVYWLREFVDLRSQTYKDARLYLLENFA